MYGRRGDFGADDLERCPRGQCVIPAVSASELRGTRVLPKRVALESVTDVELPVAAGQETYVA